ncbi:hypothetical protein F4859DRAFT_523583 [Xylaria cf. heliscus]|nr:hypothetical protein F4859DRAFT_523583 [Xylaria cf. heliscus]
MDVMNVQQILMIPGDEIDFVFDEPDDAPADKLDPKYDRLRIERRGLREWKSFEGWPPALRNIMTQPTHVPVHWRPDIEELDRYAAAEINVVDLLKKTIIGRVNCALRTASHPVRIIGTPKFFGSNGEGSQRIGPDLVVIDGRPPTLDRIRHNVVAFGDVKVKQPRNLSSMTFLPETNCYEGWLAQPVQACLGLNIPFGFLLTNRELIIFQLVRMEDEPSSTRVTRGSAPEHYKHTSLTPSRQREAIYSSPMQRQQENWLHFYDGDTDIPSIDAWRPRTPPNRSTALLSPPPAVRHSHFEISRTRMLSSPPPVRQRDRTPSDSQGSVFTDNGDPNLDLSFLLMRTYNLMSNPEVGIRLFELIMLAKELKNKGQLRIGPHKYV